MSFRFDEFLSSSIRATILITVLLAIFFIVVGRKIKKLDPKETPKGFIFGCIMLVDVFNKFLTEYMDKEKFKFFGPYLFTVASFLVVANLASLFGLNPPLANLGVALAFTVMTFVAIKVAEFKYITLKQKIGGLLGEVKPLIPLMLPINLIGEVSTPFTMGLRLFVNLLSGVVIATMVFSVLGWIGSIIAGLALHLVFDIFFGVIQAFVFLMLSTINISLATDA